MNDNGFAVYLSNIIHPISTIRHHVIYPHHSLS